MNDRHQPTNILIYWYVFRNKTKKTAERKSHFVYVFVYLRWLILEVYSRVDMWWNLASCLLVHLTRHFVSWILTHIIYKR